MEIATLLVHKGSCTDLEIVFSDDSGPIDITDFTFEVTDCIPAALNNASIIKKDPTNGIIELSISSAIANQLSLGDNWFRIAMTVSGDCKETSNKIRLLVV